MPTDRFIFLTRYNPVNGQKSWTQLQDIENSQEKIKLAQSLSGRNKIAVRQ